MTNRDTNAASSYHDTTKLSYINLSNKPPLYKTYSGAASIPLPADFPPVDVPTLNAVSSSSEGQQLPLDRTLDLTLDLNSLARLLYLSAGLIRKAQLPVAGEVHYRAAASAGALYPIEVYVVCGDIPGLAAGVYHFSPPDFSLNLLRQGDHRDRLSAAVDGDELVAGCPVSLVLTANFWRSAWKYRARSYRYCFWDAGTILSNLLAAASASGQPARVLAGFLDEAVNELLGLDGAVESGISVVPLGQPERVDTRVGSGSAAPLLATEDGQPQDTIDYPEIQQVHQASNLDSAAEVASWRLVGPKSRPPQTAPAGRVHSLLDPISEGQKGTGLEGSPLGRVVSERGSTRRFDRSDIPFEKFAAILTAAASPVSADFLGAEQTSILHPYLIVNGVQNLASGSYFLSAGESKLEELRLGEMRHEAGHLCFEQALGADASAVVYFMADLDDVLAKYGNRGYRAAQLEAGILGGRIYLCAHALGLGATGMTFYDDDVTEFFSPHAAGKSLMFLVALGKTHANNRVRPFRSRIGVLLDSLARGAGTPAHG